MWQKPARSKGVTLKLDVTPLLRAGFRLERWSFWSGPDRGGPRWTKVDQTGLTRQADGVHLLSGGVYSWPDGVYLRSDGVYPPPDSVYLPSDGVYLSSDGVCLPPHGVYLRSDGMCLRLDERYPPRKTTPTVHYSLFVVHYLC